MTPAARILCASSSGRLRRERRASESSAGGGAPSCSPRAALDYAAAEGLCVVPTCSYTRVGKPGSSLLEQDETRVGGLAMQQASDARLLPEEVQVRDPAWDQHDVEGGFAHHLKRDAEVTALRVPRLRLHEAWLA